MHNLATPIKITMGKGFVMASRVGVIEFVFKDNGNRNVVVLLPALVCEDFDTDLVILSGPMLNSVNIGIGPTTNYLISLNGKDTGSVPVTLTDDVQAVPIDKTSNGMPYVKYNTVENTPGPLYDLMTGEPYRYLDALIRARSAFPGMLRAAAGDDEDVELLQDMQCLINVLTGDAIMREDRHEHEPKARLPEPRGSLLDANSENPSLTSSQGSPWPTALPDLKDVPREQLKATADAVAKELDELSRNGVFELVPPVQASAVVPKKTQAHTARMLRRRLNTIAPPFTVFLMCYGLATTCTLVGELPIEVVGGVEKNDHLRRDFEYQNPRARQNGLSFDDITARAAV